jgi:imidazolonepropionase-like amidohydrolase
MTTSIAWARTAHGRRFLLAALLLLAAGPARAGQEEKGARPLVFRNVSVFDGVRMLPRGSVVVRNGKVADVGTRGKEPEGAQVIDGGGKTLLPGLIDCHTHVLAPDLLQQALIFGVTTELDMFTDAQLAARIKKEQAAGGGLDRADLRSAGTLATAPGGHGTEYGFKIPTLTAPEEAQAFVDARLAEGSDYIKIVYDDGKTYGLSFPTLSKATLAAVIAAAHRRHRLAVVHIGSLQGARDAIEAGADGLAHLFVDRAPDAEFGRFVAAHHAFVVPTLSVLRGISGTPAGRELLEDRQLAAFLAPADVSQLGTGFPFRAGLTATYAAAEAAVRQLKAARVPILAGTDAPNPGTTHGASLHGELELLVRAGLTPLEALAAATSVPADRFHLDDRGRIAPGMRADLFLVEGNPTADIRATRRIAGVWKLGVAPDREGYRVALQRQRGEAGRLPAVPPGSEAGLVSDFEEGKPAARFGAGWAVSTDSLAGGKSSAAFKVVEGGAQGSKGSLLIEGEVIAGGPATWAGAIFYPGPAPMAPANLSAKKEIIFWAKGDGRTYSVMLFAPSRSFRPLAQTFVAAPEWKEFVFPLARFEGFDGRDLAGLFIGAGPPAGKFALQIDDVRLR